MVLKTAVLPLSNLSLTKGALYPELKGAGFQQTKRMRSPAKSLHDS